MASRLEIFSQRENFHNVCIANRDPELIFNEEILNIDKFQSSHVCLHKLKSFASKFTYILHELLLSNKYLEALKVLRLIINQFGINISVHCLIWRIFYLIDEKYSLDEASRSINNLLLTTFYKDEDRRKIELIKIYLKKGMIDSVDRNLFTDSCNLFEGLAYYIKSQKDSQFENICISKLGILENSIRRGIVSDLFIVPYMKILINADKYENANDILCLYQEFFPNNPNTSRYLRQIIGKPNRIILYESEEVKKFENEELYNIEINHLKNSNKQLYWNSMFSFQVLPEPAPLIVNEENVHLRSIDKLYKSTIRTTFDLLDHESWFELDTSWRIALAVFTCAKTDLLAQQFLKYEWQLRSYWLKKKKLNVAFQNALYTMDLLENL